MHDVTHAAMLAPVAIASIVLAALSPPVASGVPSPVARPSVTVDTIQIREWKVPWENTRPRDPAVAKDGRIWFCGQEGNYIAALNPRTGEFKRYELEPNTNPHNLIIDAQGMVWYAGNRNAHIGRLDPASGGITKFPMPDPAARDPHTLVFDKTGKQIWFTVQRGGFVGRLTMATGKVELVKIPGTMPLPYGIWMDSHNRPWFNEFGVPRIGMIEPSSLALKEFALPNADARGRRIAITSDDQVWYVDFKRGQLGRLDPNSGKVDEWEVPGGKYAAPYMLTVDNKDRLWFSETGKQPTRLVGFDPRSMQFTTPVPVPSGGISVRYGVFHTPTASVWFGTDANTIARAQLP